MFLILNLQLLLMAIKCIIFDVGGVLVKRIEHTHEALNKELGKKVFDRKDVLHRKSLLGKLTEKEFYRMLSQKHGISAKHLQSLSDEKYLKIAKLNKDVIRTAKRLRKNYKTCILSNVSPMRKKHDHVMNLYSNFGHLVLSCDVGAAKPGAKIFRLALKKLKAKPEECIYSKLRYLCYIT